MCPRQGLVEAVNLAIYLRRPLLLEGEAGCGKTRLASAVAFELGLPFYFWPVRSTSRGQDGLYRYEAILRLHDVQTAKFEAEASAAKKGAVKEGAATAEDTAVRRDPRNPKDYRHLGALGNAFSSVDRPAVVLIDEIDKADIDFPNDLLTVLDKPWKFEIPETGETIQAKPEYIPLVFITSNKEKGELPAPFLRRCIYCYVDFPDDPERLKAIVRAHYKQREVQPPAGGLLDAAVKRFLELRKTGELFKKPGTSEFLDWVEALRNFEGVPYPVDKVGTGTLPFPELLFKLWEDFRRFRKVG